MGEPGHGLTSGTLAPGRGDRPAVLSDAAAEFRPRFRAQGAVRAVRTFDVASETLPAALAFEGAARAINPFVTVVSRLIVVQCDDFDGRLRTLVWGSAAPAGTVQKALERIGLALADLDFVSWELALEDGDVELGVGCALLSTPGRVDGHRSLCINTPEGIWVSSDNGVAADSWHPHLSRIPGLRAWAELSAREVVMNADALDPSAERYDSMVREKALADVNRRDARWVNVFPSRELAPRRRQWPIMPTFIYGGINYGRVHTADGNPGR